MSRVVGEGIQDYEVILAAVKDEVRLVLIFFRFLAQDAATLLRPGNILYSPWCPEMFHNRFIRYKS